MKQTGLGSRPHPWNVGEIAGNGWGARLGSVVRDSLPGLERARGAAVQVWADGRAGRRGKTTLVW